MAKISWTEKNTDKEVLELVGEERKLDYHKKEKQDKTYLET